MELAYGGLPFVFLDHLQVRPIGDEVRQSIINDGIFLLVRNGVSLQPEARIQRDKLREQKSARSSVSVSNRFEHEVTYL